MRKAAHRALVSLIALSAATGAFAESRGGGVVGYVEDTRGMPVSGAIISLFGKGVGRAGLVTLSDSSGRFSLSSLPAGSYTLRALGEGHAPAFARQITVLPNRESLFTVSLTPLEQAAAEEIAADRENDDHARELRWLLRHKQRSVLEQRKTAPADASGRPEAASWLPGVDGTLEVMASQAGGVAGVEALAPVSGPSNVGLVRLAGRFGNSGRWNVGGLLAESESATWRMAGEFVIQPGGGHELQVGTGYGSRLRRNLMAGETDRLDSQNVGALSVQDRWQTSRQFALTLGGRFSYIGFVDDHNHLDPLVQAEFMPDERTSVTTAVTTRTLAPGGDLLTLSTLAAAPALAYAMLDAGLRPEHSTRYEVGIEQRLGPNRVRALAFYEGVSDQLVNAFEGASAARTLRIYNRNGLAARGMGVGLSRRLGNVISGSVTYTYGRAWRPDTGGVVAANHSPAEFHDLVTRVETTIDGTDTRLLAYYRLSRLKPEGDERTFASSPGLQGRFELQLSQGLPFLASFTGAEWDVRFAVRNLFYEPGEGALLDEVTVANPPKRVLGGISVRF